MSLNKVISEIERVKTGKLPYLHLRGKDVEEIPPEVGQLDYIQNISIGNTKITHLPPEIGKVHSLRSLNLGNNQITRLPSEIGQLTNLTTLHLSRNQLTNLPSEIGLLINLTSLDLSHNNLSTLPHEIGQLVNLEELILNDNLLTVLPDEIGQLTNLVSLNLSNNQLATLTSQSKPIPNTEFITLSSGKIIKLPRDDYKEEATEITKILGLKKLDLSKNILTRIPLGLENLNSLEYLDLQNNNLNIPDEIIAKRNDPKGILNYYERIRMELKAHSQARLLNEIAELLSKMPDYERVEYIVKNYKRTAENAIRDSDISEHEQAEIEKEFWIAILELGRTLNAKPLNQLKIIIVGQGNVGKTSLIRRVIDGEFNPSESKTEGVAINQWHIRDYRNYAGLVDIGKTSPIRRIIDGVFNSAKSETEDLAINQSRIGDFRDQTESKIQLNIWDFGGQEIMHATHQFFLTKRSLYLLVLDSRLTQEENRVEYWLKIIQSFGGESPVLIVGNKIDQHPLDIDRTGLQKKYPNIVGILETSAATGAGIEALKAAITEQVNNLPHVRDLLPETWFTVKTKLEELGRQSNFITHDKYLDLCAENEVSDETSQRTLIGFLHDLGVVLHFQDDPRLEALGILNPQWVTNGVYKILNSHTLFQNKGALTTSMLDEILNLPEYPRGKRLFIVDMMKKFELCYDIEPDKIFLVPDLLPKDQPDLKFNGVPAFEYAYPVLPSSVITRFIVRMNQKIDDGLVWRTGVVLKIGENNALVKADIEDRKITIAIEGVEHTRRDALSAIRFQLNEIHASIKGLNPQKMVPIPNAPNADPLEYEYLLMLEREGDETCRVKDGNRLITINVRQILSGIESEAQRRNAPEGSVIIYGDVHTSGGDFTGRDKSVSAGDRSIVVDGNAKGNLISGDENEVKK